MQYVYLCTYIEYSFIYIYMRNIQIHWLNYVPVDYADYVR